MPVHVYYPGVPAAGAGQRQLEKKLGCRQIPFWESMKSIVSPAEFCGAVHLCPASGDLNVRLRSRLRFYRESKRTLKRKSPNQRARSGQCIQLADERV